MSKNNWTKSSDLKEIKKKKTTSELKKKVWIEKKRNIKRCRYVYLPMKEHHVRIKFWHHKKQSYPGFEVRERHRTIGDSGLTSSIHNAQCWISLNSFQSPSFLPSPLSSPLNFVCCHTELLFFFNFPLWLD